mmetsp:Transcript_1334/g.3364  ORF Transcript_1334/g.3364 Transcript_1334/m.3364 type:complete len:210 (+) Transcript_1334:123-752(+)
MHAICATTAASASSCSRVRPPPGSARPRRRRSSCSSATAASSLVLLRRVQLCLPFIFGRVERGCQLLLHQRIRPSALLMQLLRCVCEAYPEQFRIALGGLKPGLPLLLGGGERRRELGFQQRRVAGPLRLKLLAGVRQHGAQLLHLLVLLHQPLLKALKRGGGACSGMLQIVKALLQVRRPLRLGLKLLRHRSHGLPHLPSFRRGRSPS